jgi:hypothetical protein
VCGKEFDAKKHEADRRSTCSRKCASRIRAVAVKNYFESIGKNKSLNCEHCNKEIKVWKCHLDQRKHHFCDATCFKAWKKGKSIGSSNPNWRGGISDLNAFLYNCDEGIAWRDAARKRDSYTCQSCGDKSNIHVHHKTRLAVLIQDFLKKYSQFSIIEDRETILRLCLSHDPFWDVSNGISLCNVCHAKEHAELRSVNA